jgi:type II secretory pathway component PulK
LIIVLALVAIALGGYLSTETRLMRYHLAHAQAKAWAKAGVYLALQRLAQDAKQADDTEPYDWLGDDWAYVPHASPGMEASVWVVQMPAPGQTPQAARHVIAIQMTDEERKLDLNAATKTHLMGLGLPDEAAQAIMDYWDVEDPSDPSEDQPDAQPPYYAKDAPLVVLEELLDVPAIQERPELVPQRADHADTWLDQLRSECHASLAPHDSFRTAFRRGHTLLMLRE